jgi:hypothetical protein
MLRALVIAAALAPAACRDARIEELRSVHDEVCACKTVACGEQAMKRLPQGAPEPEARRDHRAKKIAKAMVECLHKLYLSDRPSTDPDAEAPEPGATGPGSSAPAARAP